MATEDARTSRWPSSRGTEISASLKIMAAAGLAVSVTTARRCVRQAVDLLAARANDLTAAIRRVAGPPYAILDRTLIPIDRVADQKPYYSGKHKRHGVNVQVTADRKGRLIWASPTLPGAGHDRPPPAPTA